MRFQSILHFLLLSISSIASVDSGSVLYLDPIFQVNEIQNVTYGNADPYGFNSNQTLRMDLYLPLGDTIQKKPVMIFAFGGAFLVGDKRQPNIPEFCRQFASRGFVVAAIDYRIGFNVIDRESAERAVFRSVQDLRAACRFLADNDTVYGIDTASFVLAGSSAGCFAGLHSSFMTDQEAPRSVRGGVFEPRSLGCANCSGNNNYQNRTPRTIAIINQWGAILDTSYIDDFPRDSVPVISFHGTNDLAVPYRTGNPFFYPIFPPVDGSEVIHQRLDNLGIFNQLVPLVGFGHEPQLVNTQLRDTIYKHASAFLHEILRPKVIPISGPKAVCSGDTLEIVAQENNEWVYHWSLNDSIIISRSNVLKVFSDTAAIFNLELCVQNKYGALGEAGGFAFSFQQSPSGGFGYSGLDSTIQILDSSQFANTISYNWGDGISSSDSLHTYDSEGPYLVTQYLESGFCTDTFSGVVDLDFCPIAAFDFTAFQNGYIFLEDNQYETSYYWDFGDGTIQQGVRNPLHVYTSEGEYEVLMIASDANCSDTARETIKVLITGISDHTVSEFQIYPNPVEDRLTIETEPGFPIEVKVYSSLGQILIDQTLTSNYLDLRDLLKGIYFLNVSVAEKNQTIRFQKH